MQCAYCGRDIPDDARWCPYCGAEQAPPEELQDENIPSDGWQDDPAPPDDRHGEDAASGWQDAPADDWDDEAEPPDDSWADDPPVPGWEDDAPYEPAPEAQDAPRSKALLIAIFAALGVALIVLLIALNVKPKPKDLAAAVTPSVTATAEPSAAPTETPVPTPTPSPKPTEKPASGGYILPDSATRRLTQADVANLTWEQCCLARNEIFARHGRIFQTPQIAAYFEAQSWYHGTVPGASFDNNSLTPTERANADFLADYETTTWGHSYY